MYAALSFAEFGLPWDNPATVMLKNAMISSANDKSTRYSTYLAGPHHVHPVLEEQKKLYYNVTTEANPFQEQS